MSRDLIRIRLNAAAFIIRGELKWLHPDAMAARNLRAALRDIDEALRLLPNPSDNAYGAPELTPAVRPETIR